MTDLRGVRADVRSFSLAVDCPLTDWQAYALRLEARTTVVVAPRQTGKSRSLAVLALWWCYRRRGQRALVVSAGEDAARRLLREASGVAMRSPLLAGSVTDEGAGLLCLSNGSEVRSVPASERQVRGWAVDLLLVDEAAQVEDDLLLGAAIPTTAARPMARVVLAGSPGAAEGAFFAFCDAGEQGSEHVRSFRWSLADAVWIGADVVDAARESLAPAQFAREFGGEFADVGAQERVIERAWIDAARDRSLEAASEVVFGLDVARRGGDESVLVSVRGGVARVEWAVRGLDLMALSGRVAASVGAAPVAVDAIGLGYGVVDRLGELGRHVIPFVASARSSNPQRWLNARSEAWWSARERFRLGVVDLDAGDRLLAGQLGAVRYGLASSGAVQIAAKESMRSSPDRADGLVIALWGAGRAVGLAGIRRMVREAASRPLHPLARDLAGLPAVRGGWKERLELAEGPPWSGSGPERPADLTSDLRDRPT